ncbi:carbon storage regulator [Rhodovulum sp. BSW8]|uniref:carbon storage regulator n=1 Tax=Rhodovulum sp. BSW8 TaxID=2259645 RepID=UPI000DE494B5|nr:carbon storage regulator [Rhodovulum sp. BSW8]RBO54657.1 carbon storage regulator [Rhodovulum sp. BSW8]
MLIRKLKAFDRLEIGDVTIEVKRVTGDNLRLAIEAPDELVIRHIQAAGAPNSATGSPAAPGASA